jgi:hypothetical protein
MEKRRLIIRTKKMTISEGDYAGWSFEAITNPPLRVIEELTGGTIASMVTGLSRIVKSWDFVDEEGELMASPSEDAIRELPIDLLNQISSVYIKETTALPQT